MKGLAGGKSRLLPAFDSHARSALCLAMLGDLLEALIAAERVDRVAVVTPDREVERMARRQGAEVVLYEPPGLNRSLEYAAQALRLAADEPLLVVLGDLPGAAPEEIDKLFESLDRLGGRGAVLAPASDGGSAALLRAPHDILPPHFGANSAQAHREHAAQRAIPWHEQALPSLSLDLDDANDLDDFLRATPSAGRPRGARTRAFLAAHHGAAARATQGLDERSSASGAREDRAADGTNDEDPARVKIDPEGIRLVALQGVPIVREGDDLAALIGQAADAQGLALSGGVLVVCQKIVSKAEGRVVRLSEVEPSDEARRIAAEDDKDARQVEVVLRESARIVRRGGGVLIVETHHGFVCANAGVDLSNAPDDDSAVLLPVDSDASAARLREGLIARGAADLGVIVSDTFGRPWREALVDVAIGCAGVTPIADERGGTDLGGRELQVTTMATADQLATAAGLLMEKSRGIPAVWVSGVDALGEGSAQDLLRDPERDLFR